MKQAIFISSVQKELAEERRALKSYILGDALLGRFFDVFLFEDMPAADRRADKVYLDQVDRCDVYLGLLGNEYGYEDAQGVSPTEREFDRATAAGKQRLIFVKGENDDARHPKMQALVRKAGGQLIRRRFNNPSELIPAVYASLVNHLEQAGVIQNRPFDEQPCPGASLDDIARGALADFVRAARAERRFPLAARTPAADVLEHLHLLADGGQPTRAAVLLFGRDPQRFMASAEIRCMHFHGTEVQRPAPYYQIFKGSLFEQVDQAVNFVLSVIPQSVGTRAQSSQAPVAYEIPPDVIREAIVNAVAHRDYASAGAVQVSVFADRIEVWNPGTLLSPLTPEQLRRPHRSLARNARICEALFLTRYVEKYGTGTLMMIRESIEHALPEPDFDQREGEFSATLWRNWLTEKVMVGLGLNDRQQRAVTHLKIAGTIGNSEYQAILGVSKRTAHRELADLVAKGVVDRVGTTGKGTVYVLGKGAAKGPKGPNGPSAGDEESAINRTNRTSQTTRNGPQTARRPTSRRKIKGE